MEVEKIMDRFYKGFFARNIMLCVKKYGNRYSVILYDLNNKACSGINARLSDVTEYLERKLALVSRA